jgi:spermidine/putrescine transport system permease protein
MTTVARTRWRRAALLAPATVLLAGAFVGPLALMAAYSLLEPGLYGGVEWHFYPYNYGRVLGAPLGDLEEFDVAYALTFLRSLKLAAITAGVSLAVCYPAAWWVARMPPRRRAFALFVITLPFFANLIVRVYAWMLILRPTGFLNLVLAAVGLGDAPIDLMFGETAVVIGLVYVLMPFMFLPLYASIEKLDPALLQASQDLGATPWQSFVRVALPLTLPGIAGGALIVFIPALGNFVVPSLLGGSKVLLAGNLIEQQFLAARNWPFGAALAMLILAAVLVAMLASLLRRAPDALVRA